MSSDKNASLDDDDEDTSVAFWESDFHTRLYDLPLGSYGSPSWDDHLKEWDNRVMSETRIVTSWVTWGT